MSMCFFGRTWAAKCFIPLSMHKTPITVYYEDTDAGGVVYYARYLAFAERARTQLLQANGLSNTALLEKEGVLLVVSEVQAKYHAPAKLEDTLVVETRVAGLKNASFCMEHRIMRLAQCLVSMQVKLACISAATGKPVRCPESLYAVLAKTE